MTLLDADPSSIIQSVDSVWGLLALIVIGIYALAWKFGRDIVSLLRTNAIATGQIQEQIVTNHGSKNIGDAIDKIWSKLDGVAERQDDQGSIVMTIARDQERHLRECREFHRQPMNFIEQEATTSESRQ